MAPAPEPDRILVQHILISFAGRETEATRTKVDAERLAQATLERVRKGEDFGGVMRELSDDPGPGVYGMCNRGRRPASPDEYERDGMVPAFGNVGFTLSVGEIGLAPFHPEESPFGWHLIKRLK